MRQKYELNSNFSKISSPWNKYSVIKNDQSSKIKAKIKGIEYEDEGSLVVNFDPEEHSSRIISPFKYCKFTDHSNIIVEGLCKNNILTNGSLRKRNRDNENTEDESVI